MTVFEKLCLIFLIFSIFLSLVTLLDFLLTTSSSFFFNSFHLILISISSHIRYISWAKQCRTAIDLNHYSSDCLILARFISIKVLAFKNSIVVLYCPKYFSRSSTDSSVHLNLFAFSTLFYTICLLVFSQLHTFYSCVSKPVCMFTISELRYHFCLVFMPLRMHQLIFVPEQTKWVDPFCENEPARQLS